MTGCAFSSTASGRAGLRKEKAAVDLWAKEIAPSHDLRKRYHAGGLSWDGFRSAYLRELDAAADAVAAFEGHVAGRRLTLLTAAKDAERSHAAVLREFLLGR